MNERNESTACTMAYDRFGHDDAAPPGSVPGQARLQVSLLCRIAVLYGSSSSSVLCYKTDTVVCSISVIPPWRGLQPSSPMSKDLRRHTSPQVQRPAPTYLAPSPKTYADTPRVISATIGQPTSWYYSYKQHSLSILAYQARYSYSRTAVQFTRPCSVVVHLYTRLPLSGEKKHREDRNEDVPNSTCSMNCNVPGYILQSGYGDWRPKLQ